MLKGASTDAGIDKEKENVRNKEIIELNRKRVQEDFTLKAKRFKTFADNNSDFAKKELWNNLLKLGDMNAFTTMNPAAREELLTTIEKSMTEFSNDKSQTFDENDIKAAQQLVSLTNLYRPTGQKLPESISQILQKEITSANPDEIKQALKEFFKQSTTTTLETLRKFSENLDANLDSLDKIRNAKAISFGSIMVVGAAGVAVMLVGHPLVFDKVKLTLEQCALVGKAALLGAHVSSHEERTMVREIQDQYVATFQSILPKSTQLLESTVFENKAKSIGQRLQENVTTTAQKLGQKLKETKIGNAIHKNIIEPTVEKTKVIGSKIADLHQKYTKPITDAITKGAKITAEATVLAGKVVVNAAKSAHETIIKPMIDTVSNAAQKTYEKTGLKDYVDKKNKEKQQTLQSQFTLASKPKSQPTEATPTMQTETVTTATAPTTTPTV